MPTRKTLIEVNPHIRRKAERVAATRVQALESSFFEGARGLKAGPHGAASRPAAKASARAKNSSSKR